MDPFYTYLLNNKELSLKNVNSYVPYFDKYDTPFWLFISGKGYLFAS